MTISIQCADCGYEAEYDDEDNAYECGWAQIDGEWYCDGCHSYCERCEEDVLETEEVDGLRICPHCIEEDTVLCADDNERHFIDNT